MNKVFFFIFSLLLSFSLLANSSVFVVSDQGIIRSDRISINDENIIRIVGKNQQLQRLTMHYSGWSLVTLDDITGWILSDSVTSSEPALSEKKSTQALEQLNSRLTELAQSNALLNDKNLSLQSKIAKLNDTIKLLKDKQLKTANSSGMKEFSKNLSTSDTKKSTPNSSPTASFMFSFKNNWVYLGVVFLMILSFVFFFIYSRSKRRHFDLNTIRRH
jgi:hypothetical protein